MLFLLPHAAQAQLNAFDLALTIADADGNDETITMGMDPAATDGFDAAFDEELPPPPPGGAFDARIPGFGNGLKTDVRATNTQLQFTIFYRGKVTGGTEAGVTLTWDDAGLPDGALRLTDDPSGANETFGVDLDGAGSSAAPDTPRDFFGYRTLVLVLDLAPPAAPTGLGATAVSPTAIDIAWTDNAGDESAYEVERGASAGGPFALVSTEAADVTAYGDTGLSAETEYCYRVRATNASGASAYSNVACATTPAEATPPVAPTGLGATAVSPTAIDLAWTDNASDESAYEVERGASVGGPFLLLSTEAADATTYGDTGLSPETESCYRVRATNPAGASAYSNVACATTPAAGLAFAPASLSLSLDEGTGSASDDATLSVTSGPAPSGPVALTAVDDATGLAPTWLTVPAAATVDTPASFTASADGLAAGTYTATVTAAEAGYADATLAVTLEVTPVASGVDFSVPFTASAGGATIALAFGTAPDATDAFDADYDRFAPPRPPDPTFDARFLPPVLGTELFDDFRLSLSEDNDTVTWTATVRALQAEYPVVLDWSGATLPAEGSLLLLAPGATSPVDFRAVSSYDLTAGCATEDPCTTIFQIVHARTTAVDLAVGTGWELLGLPNEPSDASYQAVFSAPPLPQPPFAWDGASYTVADTLAVGAGFWAFFDQAATYTVTGIAQPQVGLSFGAAGWQLIAGPSCDLPVSAIQDPGGIILPGTFFRFDEVYVEADTLRQGEGTWVRVEDAGALTLDCAGTGSRTPARTTEPAAAFTVTAGDGTRSRALVLGHDPAATDDFDVEFDRLAPPPAPTGAFDARLRGTDDGTPTDYYDDVRRFEVGMDKVFALVYAPAAGSDAIVLSWDPAALDGLGRFTLASDAGSSPDFALDMRTAASVSTADHPELAAGAFVVWSEPAAVDAEGGSVLPEAFALRGTYPNPTAGATSLVLDLPETAEVAVEVFDVLGRRALELSSLELPSGLDHAVDLDTARLPAGAYLYRVTATMPSGTAVGTGRLTIVN
ncbi:MAG: T9SS type A sorting domain-containing protein [Bacteroidota bacterium]